MVFLGRGVTSHFGSPPEPFSQISGSQTCESKSSCSWLCAVWLSTLSDMAVNTSYQLYCFSLGHPWYLCRTGHQTFWHGLSQIPVSSSDLSAPLEHFFTICLWFIHAFFFFAFKGEYFLSLRILNIKNIKPHSPNCRNQINFVAYTVLMFTSYFHKQTRFFNCSFCRARENIFYSLYFHCPEINTICAIFLSIFPCAHKHNLHVLMIFRWVFY